MSVVVTKSSSSADVEELAAMEADSKKTKNKERWRKWWEQNRDRVNAKRRQNTKKAQQQRRAAAILMSHPRPEDEDDEDEEDGNVAPSFARVSNTVGANQPQQPPRFLLRVPEIEPSHKRLRISPAPAALVLPQHSHQQPAATHRAKLDAPAAKPKQQQQQQLPPLRLCSLPPQPSKFFSILPGFAPQPQSQSSADTFALSRTGSFVVAPSPSAAPVQQQQQQQQPWLSRPASLTHLGDYGLSASYYPFGLPSLRPSKTPSPTQTSFPGSLAYLCSPSALLSPPGLQQQQASFATLPWMQVQHQQPTVKPQ